MNKNELTGVIGVAIITIALGISVPFVMASVFALGIILLVLTVILGIGVIVSVVAAIQEHLTAKAIDESLNDVHGDEEEQKKEEEILPEEEPSKPVS